jgi:hypothetical protein
MRRPEKSWGNVFADLSAGEEAARDFYQGSAGGLVLHEVVALTLIPLSCQIHTVSMLLPLKDQQEAG